jgi:hypothetical protein
MVCLDIIVVGSIYFMFLFRSTSLTVRGTYITFNAVHVDTHNGWAGYEYVIPVSRTWVITLQCGDYPGERYFGITRLTFSTRSEIIQVHHTWCGFGIDQDGATVVANLNSGTTIIAQLADSPLYSDANYQTSLMGFLYSPVSLPAEAWCVTLSSDTIGPVDPVRFDILMTNEGNGWDESRNVFLSLNGGTYYVTLTSLSDLSVYPMKLELVLNGVVQASICSPHTQDLRTRTRAIILRLAAGDQLWERLPDGYLVQAGATNYVFTTFSGFRIQP